MRILLVITILVITSFSAYANNTPNAAQQRVAMVISGYGNTNKALSYDQEELAQSYLVLTRNGFEVDIVTPTGGAVVVKSNKDHLPYIQEFKSTTPVLTQLANTLSASDAAKKQYDGLFIVGGDGAMFDLPTHPGLQQFISQFVHQQKPIAAVCHGPAALVNIKLADGSYFVKNKRVNSFTKIEDYAFKKENVELYPFIVQTELENKGALFESNKAMLPYVAIDNNLITAQNPMSVAKAADALVLKMGHAPSKRALFKDEATFDLLSKAYSEGNYLIDVALAKNPNGYDLNYLAVYGYYAFQIAETSEQKKVELAMMQQIKKHVVMLHPQYQLALIAANLELGLKDQANTEYSWLKTNLPDLEMPKSLLEKLGA